MKIKVCAVSDIHGHLPDIPSCDLFLAAGDLCPGKDHHLDFQQSWLDTNFRYWLRNVDAKCKVFCAGNHDFVCEYRSETIKKLFKNEPNTYYLQDSYCYYEGLKIYGFPHTKYFYGWAFNLHEEDLEKKWIEIPDDTDIIVTHGPAYGFGDLAARVITDDNETEWPGGEHVGSPGLLERIDQIKPKLCVYGHIHKGRGEWKWGDTILANVTVVNEKYKNVYEPWITELEVNNA